MINDRLNQRSRDGKGEWSGLGFTALFIGAAFIGFAPIFVRLSEVGPLATAFWRVFLAQPILWSMVWWEQGSQLNPAKPIKDGSIWGLGLVGVLFGIEISTWHYSIALTSVANATLLANLAPVFVTLAARRFYNQRMTRTFFIGLTVSMVGTFFLAGASFQLGLRPLIGDFFGILTAIGYAMYLLSVNRQRLRFSAPSVMAYAGAFSSFLLFFPSLIGEERLLADTGTGWSVLIGLAAISHVGGQGLIAYGLGRLPAPISSLILLFQPVVAALLAWGLLGEGMSAPQLVGAVVILAGIYTARRGS